MNRTARKYVHLRLVSGLAVVVAAVVIGLAVSKGGPEPGGPLPSGQAILVEYPLPVGATGTWGTVLPKNPTGEPIELESVTPIGVTGSVIIVDVVASYPDRDGSAVGTQNAFPPKGAAVIPVRGSIIPAAGDPYPHLQVLVGVRRDTDQGSGTIEGLRIRYWSGGKYYERDIPASLSLRDVLP